MYRIIPDTTVSEHVATLPTEALTSYAEVLEILELTPWNGRAQHLANPDAPVRRWAFDPGQADHIIDLIMQEQQELHLLLVQWWG